MSISSLEQALVPCTGINKNFSLCLKIGKVVFIFSCKTFSSTFKSYGAGAGCINQVSLIFHSAKHPLPSNHSFGSK